MAPFKAAGDAVKNPIAGNSKPLEASGAGEVASITQPDNPGQQSSQNYETVTEDTLTFSEPTRITESVNLPNGGFQTRTIFVPAGSTKGSKQTQKVGQVIGAAQKDDSRNTAAMLASFQWVQWIGIVAFLLGVAGFFHPVVRVALAGRDNALALAGAGLVLIFGPFLFVAYAKYFALALIGWAGFYMWNKYVHSKGQLDILKDKQTNTTK